jgi:tryptophan-rich sensory protein
MKDSIVIIVLCLIAFFLGSLYGKNYEQNHVQRYDLTCPYGEGNLK